MVALHFQLVKFGRVGTKEYCRRLDPQDIGMVLAAAQSSARQTLIKRLTFLHGTATIATLCKQLQNLLPSVGGATGTLEHAHVHSVNMKLK